MLTAQGIDPVQDFADAPSIVSTGGAPAGALHGIAWHRENSVVAPSSAESGLHILFGGG